MRIAAAVAAIGFVGLCGLGQQFAADAARWERMSSLVRENPYEDFNPSSDVALLLGVAALCLLLLANALFAVSCFEARGPTQGDDLPEGPGALLSRRRAITRGVAFGSGLFEAALALFVVHLVAHEAVERAGKRRCGALWETRGTAVVATLDLPTGVRLEASGIAAAHRLREELVDTRFTDARDVVGRRTRQAILAGEILREERLVDPDLDLETAGMEAHGPLLRIAVANPEALDGLEPPVYADLFTPSSREEALHVVHADAEGGWVLVRVEPRGDVPSDDPSLEGVENRTSPSVASYGGVHASPLLVLRGAPALPSGGTP